VKLRLGRIAIAVIAAEVLGILALVVLVAIFGPPGFEAAQLFAERLGPYVGPISGFVLCLLGGYWVARGFPYGVRNGLAMGIAAAILDLAIAVTMADPFQWLLLISNAGRILGGTMGGLLASRNDPQSRPNTSLGRS
jgi:hypothetical protein